MREYIVDLTSAASWEDVIEAFNKRLIRPVGGQWDGNLDAFNDYLSWPEEANYRLVIRGWSRCAPLINLQRGGSPVMEIVAEILRDNTQVVLVMD
jgi:hypothetical protein